MNDWSGVEPERFFSFLGFGIGDPYSGTGNIGIGFAKQFEPLYLGIYFDGKMPSFESTSNKDPKTKHKENTESNGYDFSALFGFGSVGVKYRFGFDADQSNNKDKAEDNKTGKDKYTIDNEIQLGINVDGDTSLTPHFGVGFKADVDRSLSDVNGKKNRDNSKSEYKLYLNAGTGITFAEKEITQSALDLDLDFDFDHHAKKYSIVNDEAKKASGYYDNQVTFTPKYTITVTPVDELALKFRVAIPIGIESSTDNYKVIDGIDNNYNKTTALTLSPYFKAAMQYHIKESFAFNAGIELGMPNFEWDFITNVPTVGDKTKSKKYKYDSADFGIKWSSGFSWLIKDVVNLDFCWNILKNDLNDFKSNIKGSDLWATLNNLICPEFAFMVSFKF